MRERSLENNTINSGTQIDRLLEKLKTGSLPLFLAPLEHLGGKEPKANLNKN